MKVYCVFFREYDKNRRFDNTLMYIASSLEKARKFCKETTDAEEHNPKKIWWFFISEDMIDCAMWEEGYNAQPWLEVWNWDGKRIDTQPVYGYKHVKIVPDNWEGE